VISSPGQLGGHPDPKKPTALREAAGVWDRESGDCIKGCDGARPHTVQLPHGSWELGHNQCRGPFPLKEVLHDTAAFTPIFGND
jgi:hypothetical protein